MSGEMAKNQYENGVLAAPLRLFANPLLDKMSRVRRSGPVAG
jgi:hypothetical protein